MVTQPTATGTANKSSLYSVIGASSVGTLIEWYDFYIFGSLASVLATKFFPEGNSTAAFLSTLATFAAGFVVRPFGALFFGRLGDLIGRKYTFMVTLLLMGGATFAIGLVPGYETIGFLAPLLVLILRLLQGLALGGEYGGAATYVAEHAPVHQRGYWTSWIQTTATAGLFVSLLVIMGTRLALSKEAFDDWGWRVPFWASVFMVGVSYLIRRNMSESPLFAKAKAEGKTATNPLKESFGNRFNFKFVLLALFGATMGQGVIFYTGQFYALSFIEKIGHVDKMQTDGLMTIALLMGTPFFVIFGWLSDKIGRKGIMMVGMLLAVFAYRPIYQRMYEAMSLNNRIEIPSRTILETTSARDPKTPGGMIRTETVKRTFTDGTTTTDVTTTKIDPSATDAPNAARPDIKQTVMLNDSDRWTLIWLVFAQVLLVTMVYGPIAAFLVELFPTRIRYTSMSLPYHIGNGVFGGLMPAVATYLATNANSANTAAKEAGTALPYAAPYLEGLWYPIAVTAVCFVIGLLYINGKDTKIDD
ncbi:MFS transporter [Spirosoma montaniterrae]|uniref:MFS transporter n=1 Tax=Spirosoma montaniterrae TaxID=1178516 RepID=A0A1P9WUE4_9BACT|nr:MFS transporter [Spirosoma montaniterrae]AQG78992.1 MFS transporter [Spirosoma montaniterrae]